MSDTPTPAIGLVLDCADPERLARFWAPALDYVDVGTAGAYAVLLPNGRPGPKLLLQKVADLHLYRISGFLPGLSAVQQTW
jgi:hypothetical protein